MNSTIRSSLTDFVKSHTSVSAAWCDKVQRKHWLRIEIVVSSWTPRVLLIDRIKSLVTWFLSTQMLQTSEYFLSSIFLDIAVQWMLFLEVPSIYSYPGTPSIEHALIKERQLEDRSFLCMACFFFLGKSVKLFDFLWHSLVSCGKKSRNRNIHRMSTFVVADKLSINCDQV